MTLKEKITDYYRRQIEEHYAPFIKEALSALVALPLSERPADLKVVKNKTMNSPNFTGGDPIEIKYHKLDLGTRYQAIIIPELDLIEILYRTGKSEDSYKVFLSFSIQKELFADLTPIKKAAIDDADLIEEFTTALRTMNI